MKNDAIGVFDSGMGGLTTVKELNRLLPHENIIYFGDTARVPYGSRSPETILRYAKEDVAFLQKHQVKMIIAMLRPERPMRRSSLSITKATRAI